MDKENIHLPQDADTYSLGAGLSVYAKSDIKNLITINNNKAHYFANQAKKFRDEAKAHCENAKNYAESNSNVTYDQLIDLRTVLETEINKKQEIGDYALKNELPQSVSELENDLSYATQDEVTSLVDEVRLPNLSGNTDKFLYSDGNGLSWEKIPREMMFSTKLLDHILTYEESKGWALQGTYVYKDAVAGSRYGYPDFYNKCVEEYNAATDNSDYLKSNVTSSGVADNKGVLSRFTNGNSVVLPESFNPDTNPFEIVIKVTTGSDVTTKQQIVGGVDAQYEGVEFGINSGKFILWLSSAGTSHDIANALSGTYTVLVETTYWVKVAWDGSTYSLSYSLAGTNFTQDITKESTLSIFGARKCLGNDVFQNDNSFLGTIDLNESYININDLRWWNGVTKYEYKTHSNGHKFFDIADKSSIDEIYNSTGMAWYYGIDTENERIFLPRNNYFEQATGNSSEVGQSVEVGLPNITGYIGGRGMHNAQNVMVYGGALFEDDVHNFNGASNYSGSAKEPCIGFDASLSNPIYGNSDTVQPNAVKKLLYICVGNTEVESTITDVVDVTTTENDTIPLFTAQYFDFTPNNVSWLKAGEQANSGGIYATCYNELVNELTNPRYDLKVIETSAMQSDVDYSEYWKVNQEEMYFITPTTLSYKALSGAVAGNGMSLGLSTGYGDKPLGGLTFFVTDADRLFVNQSNYGANIGTKGSSGSSTSQDYTAVGVTTDPTKSGIIAEQSTSQLYFKVANAVENLELLDAGAVMESLADKISRQDCKAYITETYVNGTSWYRVYSDGWCEQIIASTYIDKDSSVTINLLKSYVDTNYIVLTSEIGNTINSNYSGNFTVTKNTDSMIIYNNGFGYNTHSMQYMTMGYIR